MDTTSLEFCTDILRTAKDRVIEVWVGPFGPDLFLSTAFIFFHLVLIRS